MSTTTWELRRDRKTGKVTLRFRHAVRVTADDGIDFLEHGEVLLTFAKDDPAGARLHAAVDALRRDIESRAELSVRRIRAKRGNGAYATGPQRARR